MNCLFLVVRRESYIGVGATVDAVPRKSLGWAGRGHSVTRSVREHPRPPSIVDLVTPDIRSRRAARLDSPYRGALSPAATAKGGTAREMSRGVGDG